MRNATSPEGHVLVDETCKFDLMKSSFIPKDEGGFRRPTAKGGHSAPHLEVRAPTVVDASRLAATQHLATSADGNPTAPKQWKLIRQYSRLRTLESPMLHHDNVKGGHCGTADPSQRAHLGALVGSSS